MKPAFDPQEVLSLDYHIELAKDIHQANVEAGWWREFVESTDETFDLYYLGTKFALITTELAEAWEAWSKSAGSLGVVMDDHLPHRQMFEVELADTAIRCYDQLGNSPVFLCDGATYLPLYQTQPFWATSTCFNHQFWLVAQAIEALRKDNDQAVANTLFAITMNCYRMAAAEGFNLPVAIEEKLDYNRKRADHKRANREKTGGKKF